MKNILALLITLIGHSLFAQYELEVGMKNGEVLRPSAIQYKAPLFKDAYLLLNDEEKVDLQSVDYYQTSEDYYAIVPMGKKKALNFARMRRVEEGAVTVFKHRFTVSEISAPGVNGVPPLGSSSTVTDYYIRNDDGQVQLIDIKILRKLIEDDPLSLQKLGKNRERFLQNIGLYAVGGVTTIIGFILWALPNRTGYGTPEVNPPPVVLAGIGIMSIPSISKRVDLKGYDALAIIADYNTRH